MNTHEINTPVTPRRRHFSPTVPLHPTYHPQLMLTFGIEPEQSANTLYLTCLPLSTTQSQLRDLLFPYGPIRNIKIITEKHSSKTFTRKSCSASIVFEKSSQAERAQTGVDGRYMGQGWRIKASWGDLESRKRTFPLNPLAHSFQNFKLCSF